MNSTETHPDQHYIDALLHNDRKTIDDIYRRFSGKIKAFIIKNNGTADDAADIFQETLIDLYQQAKYKNLKLTCPFEPFLILLCKRKWLNTLKKNTVLPVTNVSESLLLNIGDDVVAEADRTEQRKKEAEKFMAGLERLGERCQEIIKVALSGEAQDKLAEKLGVTYAYFRKKKSECMASLIKLINTGKV